EDATAFSSWNSGLMDRIIPSKFDYYTQKQKEKESGEKKNNKEETLNEFVDFKEKYAERLIQLNRFANNLNEIDSDTKIMKSYIDSIQRVSSISGRKSSPTIGFFPINLNLLMNGLSGIKIYQKFSINSDFLPSNYPETIEFLVKGISHKVDNKWETSVETFMVPKNDITIQPTSSISTKLLVPSTSPYQDQGTIDDPAPIINPKHIGSLSYNSSDVAKDQQKQGFKNSYLSTTNPKSLVSIEGGRYLHPSAAKAYQKWTDELKSQGITYNLSSAYRDFILQNVLSSNKPEGSAAAPGSSPHGWGGAVDLSNLYQLVGGSTNPSDNLKGRKTNDYKKIAEIGAKYGWYNPWRLSDNSGVDEVWHFEYWGIIS
ncbi:MAG: D-alanyl-D-alanine carboxypeptidase family protein, partial [Nanoarchaeota archaeon]